MRWSKSVCLLAFAAAASPAAAVAAPPAATSHPNVSETYGKLPIAFEANRGQTDSRVRFFARAPAFNLFLTRDEALLDLHRWRESEVIRMRLVNASKQPRIIPEEQLPGRNNYFRGSDRGKWITGIPTYAQVRYQSVYPGVDLVYHANERQIEYDFVVQAGADPNVIGIAFETRSAVRIDSRGGVFIPCTGGGLEVQKPVVYQDVDGERREVYGEYVLSGHNQVKFRIGEYNRAKPLIIDPVIVYSSFLGGSGGENAFGIAVDATGNTYITGQTTSPNFPTASAIAGTLKGFTDAFVTKINASGTAIVYSTYFGGSGNENQFSGAGITVDAAGNAYITGQTVGVSSISSDFPTTTTLRPCQTGAAFAAKLSPSGSLIYSLCLGGDFANSGLGIAVDSAGNAVVAGFTSSAQNFTFADPYQSTFGGASWDAFVAKINSMGTGLVYSTLLGGNGNERATAVAVDSSGNAWVAGWTGSANFPLMNAFQTTFRGGSPDGDAFVSTFSPSGALLYSTYFGGAGNDRASGIALDSAGNPYITGWTNSDQTTFPLANALIPVRPFNGNNPFVTKLNASGSSLMFSTYLNGNGSNQANAIAVDALGNAYITGVTTGASYLSVRPLQAPVGGTHLFVTKLNASGLALIYSTYWGGNLSNETGNAIAADMSGAIYVAGQVSGSSPNYPVTAGAFQTGYGGGGVSGDTFVLKIEDKADLSLTAGAAPEPVSLGGTLTYTLSVTNNGPSVATGVRITDALPSGTMFVSADAGCSFASGVVTCIRSELAVGDTYIISITATAPGSGYLVNTAEAKSDQFDPTSNVVTTTTTVAASNTPPTVSAAGTVSVSEGALAVHSGTYSDPDADSVALTASIGTTTKTGTNSGTWNWSYQTTDGPAQTQTVTVTANDGRGGSGAGSFSLVVLNVPPSVSNPVVLAGPSNEGAPVTASAAFSDAAGAADVPYTCTVNYGDGSGALAGSLSGYACSGPPHTYVNEGSYTVTISVTDKDGGTGSRTFSHSVVNVPPAIVSLTVTPSIDENGAVTLSGVFADPGTGDAHAVAIDWRDGSSSSVPLAAGARSFLVTHQYLDDDPAGTASDLYNIVVSVSDNAGGVGTGSVPVTVRNVAPVITSLAGPMDPLPSGTAASLTMNFTDVGTRDIHTCTFDWDDGSAPAAGTVTELAGFGSCTAARAYTVTGVYTVRATITDDDTGAAARTYEFIVVYDPSAGFVTGGGWINSPPGAYTTSPSLTGRANFGFVSKYQKGAKTPTGQTEFQFQIASFNFRSSIYEWLVVAGAKAQFKGSGSVNASGDYGFLLTATDGQQPGGEGVDKLRIKIWDKSTNVIMYDNVAGASDDIDSANPQALGGGSIVIHAN